MKIDARAFLLTTIAISTKKRAVKMPPGNRFPKIFSSRHSPFQSQFEFSIGAVTIPYTLNGVERSYYPDFLVHIDDGRGAGDPLNLVLECTGAKKKEQAAKVAMAKHLWIPAINIKKGFVYRRVPHVTLKAIANNEEINAIHARWQPEIETALAAINQATGNAWQEGCTLFHREPAVPHARQEGEDCREGHQPLWRRSAEGLWAEGFRRRGGRRKVGLLKSQGGAADGETIVAGKDEMERAAVGADPLRGEAAGFAGADVPLGRMEDRGPRAPGLGCVVDSKAAGEAGIVARPGLVPQVELQCGVIDDAAAVALAWMREDCASPLNIG
jgi:hypothetical protein